MLLLALLPSTLVADVRGLVKDLKSRDVETRMEAAESLGRMQSADAIAPLAAALSDPNPRVRRAAASALWESSKAARPAIPALRAALSDAELSVVIRAAGALIAMDVPEKELAAPLRSVLRGGDTTDRFMAARALIGIEAGDRLVAPLVDYAKTETDRDNLESARKAMRYLGQQQDRAVIAPLLSELRRSPAAAHPILIALGELKPPPGDRWTETLVSQLSSASPQVRVIAAELVGRQKSDAKLWVLPVARLMTDAEGSVRGAAIRSLQSGGGLALDGLDAVLQAVRSERDPDIRARAVEAAGEIADASFPIDASAKAAAAKRALPVLVAVVEKDTVREVRANAVRAINKLQLDSATVVPVLAKTAVEGGERDVRVAALQALRNRGSDAKAAADTIRPLTSDPEPTVQLMAKATMESFGSSYSNRRSVPTVAAADPEARERGLAALRENKLQYSEDDYFRALNDVDLESVTAFLDAGMSPNHRFPRMFGDPALRVVVEQSCDGEAKAVVKLLLARGADPKIADDRGNTPLMAAARTCDAETIKLLLAAGADMNATNITGLTAFEFGLTYASEGAATLAAAGYRLPPAKVKLYTEAYKDQPKMLTLVRKATKAAKK